MTETRQGHPAPPGTLSYFWGLIGPSCQIWECAGFSELTLELSPMFFTSSLGPGPRTSGEIWGAQHKMEMQDPCSKC